MVHLQLPATGAGAHGSTCFRCPPRPHGASRLLQEGLAAGSMLPSAPRALWSRSGATTASIATNSSSSGSSMPSTSEPECAQEQHMDDPSLEAAWKLLQEFTAKQFRGLERPMVATKSARDTLRAALLLAFGCPYPPSSWTSAADTGVLMGITASDARLAVRALRDWCQVLGVPFVLPVVRSATGSTDDSSSSSSSSGNGSGGQGADASSSDATTTSNSSRNSSSSLAAFQGPVYLKYNSKTALCYVSPYRGKDSGVLVQLGQVQLGFLPLGLWDEGMAQPPPVV